MRKLQLKPNKTSITKVGRESQDRINMSFSSILVEWVNGNLAATSSILQRIHCHRVLLSSKTSKSYSLFEVP